MNVDGKYLIMHEDICIGLVSIVENRIHSVVVNPKCVDYFPIGYEISNSGLAKWLENRGIPVTRQGLKMELGNMTKFEYMLLNLGLSLTDHYWLLPEEKSYTWGSINLYSNLFRAEFSLNLDRNVGKDIRGRTNFVPSSSLKGDLRKKWIIDSNGIRRLVKGNYNDSCRQSIGEVFATWIHSMQNSVTFVPYSLIKISYNSSEVIGCECPNFTDLSTEFVSAYDLLNMSECGRAPKKKNDINWYEYYIQYTSSLGLDLRDFMDYMFMIDFLITNTDRHLNNFGVIRDSSSLAYKCVAPIFDSGNSLFYKSSYIPVDKGLLSIEITSFKGREVEMLSLVRNRGLVNINRLPSGDDLYKLLEIDKVTEENRERTVQAYNKKKQYLDEFQNGANLWSYKYLRKNR